MMFNIDPTTDHIQRAVAFFKHPDRSRLLNALYMKYISIGHVGGQIVLKAATIEERRELASFFNKRLSPLSDVTVRLADFQKALDESSFACSLPDLLSAFYPDRPHITNPQRRETRTLAHEHFYAALQSIASAQSPNAPAQRWLQQGAHGTDWLFAHYKNESTTQQKLLLEAIHTLTHALDQLPAPAGYERLAIFAQRISGDPHAFDFNTFTGRLLFHALSDLANQNIQAEFNTSPTAPEIIANQTTQQEATQYPDSSSTDAALDAADFIPEHTSSAPNTYSQQKTTIQDHFRLLLYYDAGLLLDAISSNVATCNLAHATTSTGETDPLIEHAGNRILLLPLRQLLAWQTLAPTSHDVYIFENPQVFEEVVDALQPLQPAQNLPLPTLICTAGWPSIASIRLLSLLTTTAPHITLHYSGDFDVQGLRIAAHLLSRYPTRCRLWHFDPTSYITALHIKATSLTPTELHSLQTLPECFSSLTTVMLKNEKKAYQEGLTQLLISDIFHRCGTIEKTDHPSTFPNSLA